MIIKNALWSPLTIKLSEGNITLKPRETKEISDEDFESEDCQKYYRGENIFILPKEAGILNV